MKNTYPEFVKSAVGSIKKSWGHEFFYRGFLGRKKDWKINQSLYLYSFLLKEKKYNFNENS